MNTSDQLQRKLALLFSVSAIQGYISKLVEVRGEFELQYKALGAIIQNTDEASRLWAKTVELAVKSPFRIKELVTYTKQLAAYRVETEKLHGIFGYQWRGICFRNRNASAKRRKLRQDAYGIRKDRHRS